MTFRPTEADFQRIATLIGFGRTRNEIHAKLIADGMTEDEFFLAYHAAQRIASDQVRCEHGVPQELVVKMSGSYYRPDTENCADCLKKEESEEEALFQRLSKGTP